MTVGELIQNLLNAIQEGQIDMDADVYIIGADGYPITANDVMVEENNEVTLR